MCLSRSGGLPLGYLNQLERRLAETEAALYGALVTLREMQPTSVIQASAKQDSAAKSARMNEWSRLPLRNWSDMERWQIAVSDHFSLEQISAETPNTNSSSTNAGPGPLHSTLGDVVASGTEMESSMHPRESVVMPGPTSSRIEAHGVLAADQFGHESDVTRQSTRAEELSRSSTLYF
ncbi:hypothetical protein N7468_004273 [Penicillium chermesinum]|uniref:Uncharacterized protein n=1 Tax=Penicillium chermesinum TaxID=63820 RepID=A0A9W9P896_9EURO|nr:uncharacterized protein N7468_004273 [Penicillium chermesinum]KAJ5239654.1 hypothetical protein N7468_004273 [Penicillium chermesinum]KAJ6166542.1 hypothetical protein N7470_001989 [Penicillium chermesinum]